MEVEEHAAAAAVAHSRHKGSRTRAATIDSLATPSEQLKFPVLFPKSMEKGGENNVALFVAQ